MIFIEEKGSVKQNREVDDGKEQAKGYVRIQLQIDAYFS